ncbi:uncharacterized protein DNG_08344 [Cephalotrichum gorgonifer]|uniref:DUF974 domain-containing protein n=1 Tax=Cephalotrichum gorgonifer TaxID=2041049 RepID=A0AAE8SZ37_9PEZI|nr:uncharacterized protein DNG_08344 [Cephalotrichum gorgonifer]
MSHQRLSRPSLVAQYPVQPPSTAPTTTTTTTLPPCPASLAYAPSPTNPDPFLLSPAVSLPLSFGSASVGETFSCTLCANNDLEPATISPSTRPLQKHIRDVRIEAEMKTPGSSSTVTKLNLTPADDFGAAGAGGTSGVDLDPGDTLQKIVSFDLREEGNHVLAVTVSYYEATELSGRTRTFRKLYQFICKPSMIVRTKSGPLKGGKNGGGRGWVLEAQLENCSEDVMQLESVNLDLREGLEYSPCNWESRAGERPVLHPGEVEQLCFVLREKKGVKAVDGVDGRTAFGVLSIGWRGEMGNRGSLTTGELGSSRPSH